LLHAMQHGTETPYRSKSSSCSDWD
jgi:hypothetical protein